MQFSFRHIILVFGVLLFSSSFLFFGRQQGTYVILMLSGLCVALISFLVVIWKDKARSKLIWVAVLGITIAVQQLTESLVINLSFKILLNSNRELFNETNRILVATPIRINYWNKAAINSSNVFSQNEKKTIMTLLEKTGILYISKDNTQIYYETYGMLDIMIGMSYFYNGFTPSHTALLRQIEGLWYH